MASWTADALGPLSQRNGARDPSSEAPLNGKFRVVAEIALDQEGLGLDGLSFPLLIGGDLLADSDEDVVAVRGRCRLFLSVSSFSAGRPGPD
jgi:hypothetical protein